MFTIFMIGVVFLVLNLNKIRISRKDIYGICLVGVSVLMLMAQTELIFFSAPLWTIFSIAAFIREDQIEGIVT